MGYGNLSFRYWVSTELSSEKKIFEIMAYLINDLLYCKNEFFFTPYRNLSKRSQRWKVLLQFPYCSATQEIRETTLSNIVIIKDRSNDFILLSKQFIMCSIKRWTCKTLTRENTYNLKYFVSDLFYHHVFVFL